MARLAGLPPAVIARAQEVLSRLESGEQANPAASLSEDLPLFSAQVERAPEKGSSPLEEVISGLHPDELSPKEALELIYRLKSLWEQES